jgi:hypothetical protein
MSIDCRPAREKSLQVLLDSRARMIATLETRLAIAQRRIRMAEAHAIQGYMLACPFIVGTLLGFLVAMQIWGPR